MLRQMLVAVDFSVWSRHAARHAFDMARAIGGTVTLLHVLETHDAGPPELEAADVLLRDLSLLARRPPGCLIVPALTGFGGPDPGADSLSGVGVDGAVAPVILTVADHLGADLIVMGQHGQGSPTARTLGRVVSRVLLDARLPVQVVSCLPDRSAVNRWVTPMADMAAL